MIGIDTTFLIQLTVQEAQKHRSAQELMKKKLRFGFCLTPQIISEFIHIVTDNKRFEKPLSVPEALLKSGEYWHAAGTRHVFPDEQSMQLFHEWMIAYHLGRKRILDTMVAAVYYTAGVRKILSSNGRDFKVFEVFEILEP